MKNIGHETPLEMHDLEVFEPAHPEKRIDDKAATLEIEIQGLKVGFARERFIYIFIISLLAVVALGQNLSSMVFAVLVIGLVIFLLGMGKYLDFPWIVLPLERWHSLIYRACERKFLDRANNDEVEPPA